MYRHVINVAGIQCDTRMLNLRAGQSTATAFPPHLWGRDRERGGDKTPNVKRAVRSAKVGISDMKQTLCRPHPPPCPSPTIRAFTPVCDGLRGDGTVRHAPSQPTQ